MSDAHVVSAHEFLRQQGSSYIVLHPVQRLLFLGYGYDEVPRAVPHCIAYHQGKSAAKQPTTGPSATGSWQPDAKAYETLVEVHKVLHLQSPPEPSGIQNGQQQRLSSSSQSPTGAGTDSDLFPSAKAGLVSSRQVAEGSDKFAWFKTQRAAPPAAHSSQAKQQHQQPGGLIPVHATGGQLQHTNNDASQRNVGNNYVPYVTGTQVAGLSSDEPYVMHWLMTHDGHITGFDTTPEPTLLDRFESAWRWAMQAELGIPTAQLSQLSVVLLVPHTMTAAEVRFLADVLLERLGFSSLVVHLDSVAATFGNGATSACVVQMDSSITNVVCVDDAVVLQPASSRRQVSLGLNDVAAALIGWMACYRHWPIELQAAGLGVACALGAHAGVYGVLMLQELVMQQCYCPKESLTLGLVGRAMLEDQPPAVLPVRTPGKPTVNYQVSLGSWAAVAAMVYFYPDLAPKHQQLAPAEAASGAASSSIESYSEDEEFKGRQYQHIHASVHGLPAAESMYLQGQLKARLEAGDTTAPPIGMYLPALEMPGPSKGDVDDLDNPSEPLTRGGSGVGTTLAAAAPVNTAAAAAVGGAAAVEAAAGAAAAERVPLDEAIFKSIVTAAAGRHDVFERLCNGILLVGPGAALRGLGPMLERRLMQRFSSAGRQQVVNVLEHRAHPTHTAWKGGALLAALDAGRENWLPRHQWVQGGMVLRPPVTGRAAKQAKAGQNGSGTPAGAAANSLSTAAAGRHAKLCYYIKAEQGQS